jgi:hypothetical protein
MPSLLSPNLYTHTRALHTHSLAPLSFFTFYWTPKLATSQMAHKPPAHRPVLMPRVALPLPHLPCCIACGFTLIAHSHSKISGCFLVCGMYFVILFCTILLISPLLANAHMSSDLSVASSHPPSPLHHRLALAPRTLPPCPCLLLFRIEAWIVDNTSLVTTLLFTPSPPCS